MANGKSKLSVCVIVLATLALTVRPAEGRLITWEIAGEISIVVDPDNELDGLIVPGSPFLVSFTYESTTPDRFPDALDNGTYLGAIRAVSGQVGGISVSNPKGAFGFFHVTNDALADIPADTFGFQSLIDETPRPVDYFKMSFSAVDLTGTIFEDDSLPLFPPDLEMLDSTSFILQTQGATSWVRGELTSITPEPTSLVLFALTGVLACRRKPHRKL